MIKCSDFNHGVHVGGWQGTERENWDQIWEALYCAMLAEMGWLSE